MTSCCRLTGPCLTVVLLVTLFQLEAAGQYTPWNPAQSNESVTPDYSSKVLFSVGALGQVTMKLSCREAEYLIALHVAAQTPFDRTSAPGELSIGIRWENEDPTEYDFTQHPNDLRTLYLRSSESPRAHEFVMRWLIHGRVRIRLPVSLVYPLPVFESWTLTGTTAEWTNLGCKAPDVEIE